MSLVIASISIRRDSEGRYFLNDLHRAAGGADKDKPNRFLRLDGTQELIAELRKDGKWASGEIKGLEPIVAVKSFTEEQGTFVVKELVYAYAMWISPAFHLKVIRAYDEMQQSKARPAAVLPDFTDPIIAARAWADEVEAKLRLQAANDALAHKMIEVAPKIEALDRIASTEGSMCIRDAAKALQLRPIDLRNWLIVNRWIYGRPGHSGWLAYQDKIQQGVMCHKVTMLQREDGSEKIVEQPRVTSKGVARIAESLQELAA